MRESFAGLGAEFVDGAVVAIQEHAAGFLSPLEDQLAIRSGLSVLFQELFAGDPQVLRQADDVFFENLGFGHAAALGALAAVDGCVDLLRGAPELALDEVVDLIQRRNFSFSPRFFSPRRLIWIKSVITSPIIAHNAARLEFHPVQECSPRPVRNDTIECNERPALFVLLGAGILRFEPFAALREDAGRVSLLELAKTGPVLRVYAISYVEPPVFEHVFDPGALVADMIAASRDFVQPDCCVEIEAAWDLWQHHDDWKLWPSAVTLSCFGSEFEHEALDHNAGDHLRIDFGLDSKFLPSEDIEGSLRIQQSNLRSLLHLVSEIDQALPVERRLLWSESGANFAEVVADALEKFGPG